MVPEHQAENASRLQTILRMTAKSGCTEQTPNSWMKLAERRSSRNPEALTEITEQLKALEYENLELRQAIETLRKASACFAQAERHRWPRPCSLASTIVARHMSLSRDADQGRPKNSGRSPHPLTTSLLPAQRS